MVCGRINGKDITSRVTTVDDHLEAQLLIDGSPLGSVAMIPLGEEATALQILKEEWWSLVDILTNLHTAGIFELEVLVPWEQDAWSKAFANAITWEVTYQDVRTTFWVLECDGRYNVQGVCPVPTKNLNISYNSATSFATEAEAKADAETNQAGWVATVGLGEPLHDTGWVTPNQ